MYDYSECESSLNVALTDVNRPHDIGAQAQINEQFQIYTYGRPTSLADIAVHSLANGSKMARLLQHALRLGHIIYMRAPNPFRGLGTTWGLIVKTGSHMIGWDESRDEAILVFDALTRGHNNPVVACPTILIHDYCKNGHVQIFVG